MYYQSIDHAVAVRFLREFETAIDRILRFPESGHCRGELYRISLIRGGDPYCVAYTTEGENLIVEAVIQQHLSANSISHFHFKNSLFSVSSVV